MRAYCEGLTTSALIEPGEITKKKQARILLHQDRKGQAGFPFGERQNRDMYRHQNEDQILH